VPTVSIPSIPDLQIPIPQIGSQHREYILDGIAAVHVRIVIVLSDKFYLAIKDDYLDKARQANVGLGLKLVEYE
jgi:hypothetical protein